MKRYLRNFIHGDGKQQFILTPYGMKKPDYVFRCDSRLTIDNFQQDQNFMEFLECEVMRDIEDRRGRIFDCGYYYEIVPV